MSIIKAVRDKLKKKKRRLGNRWNKYKTLRWVFPRAYKKAAKEPVQENKVVFVEIRLSELTNSFKLLYDELVKNYDLEIHVHFLRNSFVKRPEYNQRCVDLMKDMATAKYIFLNEASNAVSCVKMRPETIVTQTWHGCGAFKKFGLSTADLIFGESRKEQLKFPYYKNYTYLTLSSPEICWAYEEAMNLHDRKEVIRPIGTSRTDVFFDQKFIDDSFRKLHDYMPESRGKKVILYAPTFRGRVAKGETPDMLNVELFCEHLSDEYVLLFKHHPLVRKLPRIAKEYQCFAQDVTDSMSIEELLAVSDICISDYSSLIFEFSLYERPMIFFCYDLSEYFDWRGFYYNYDELTPGPTFSTNMEMIDYIKNIDTRFDKQRVIDFKNKFMSSCDGHATERIMDLVFGDNLQKYKRPQPLEGEYHMIPGAEGFFSDRQDRIIRLGGCKERITKAYTQASQAPVQSKKVVLLQVPEGPSAALDRLAARLQKKEGYAAAVFEADPFSGSADALAGELATAETIVLARDCEYLNLLEIRPQTKVIQIWDQVLPFEKIGYGSKEAISGYENDYLRVAPLYRNYSSVVISSRALVPIYKEAMRVKEDRFAILGTAETDALLDGKFREKAKKKLVKLFPGAKDKKVIFYLPEERRTLTRPNTTVFLNFKLMREYLKDDYILAFSYDVTAANRLPQAKYYKEFMYNINVGEQPGAEKGDCLTVEEAMAAADVMIGDYREEIFSYAVLDRPLYLYAPDVHTHFYESDAYFNYEEIAPGSIYTDDRALIDDINHGKYDSARRDQFRKNYLTECDGHVIDRIIERI